MQLTFAPSMNGQNPHNTFIRKISAIGMILSLVWLTISLPFVFEARQQLSRSISSHSSAGKEDNSNPFGNTTEEKTPPTVNEEYLHHEGEMAPSFSRLSLSFKEYLLPSYPSHTGELISPPPEV